MPGCGKSTLGKAYTQHTGHTFIDMDEVIIEAENRSIEAIYEEGGEFLFRQIEHRHIKRFLGVSNTVVCTGGGLPIFNNNMALMNAHGITVFMDVSPEALWNRVKHTNFKGRPIYQNQTPEEVLQTIRDKSAERRPIYEQADIHLRSNEIELPMLLDALKQKFTGHS